MPSTLPPEFADLEAFSDWALPTERERYAKRLASNSQPPRREAAATSRR